MTLGHAKVLLLASAAAVLITGAPVRAADMSAPVATDKHEWDVAFGVTITSDYISRGYTQTDGGAAVQPWAELDIGKFYAGYWGSNVSNKVSAAPTGVDAWESDLSIGVRPTWGPVNFDFGYVRYVYSNQAFFPDYGELYAKASFNPVEPVTIGGSIFYDPDHSATYVEANGAYTFHTNWSVSGAVGVTGGSSSVTSWNAGLSWSPYDWLKLDGRYYGGPTANKFVVALSLSSSLKKIGMLK